MPQVPHCAWQDSVKQCSAHPEGSRELVLAGWMFFGAAAALPRSITRLEPSVPGVFFLRPALALQSRAGCAHPGLCALFSEGTWLGTRSSGFSANGDTREALWLCWALAE